MTRLHLILSLATFLSFGTASAAPVGDLTASSAVASDLPSSAPVGGPAQFTWPIDQAADELVERPTAHVASATGHGQTVSAAALRRGVALPISLAGAFLKVSPQGGTLGEVVVVSKDGPVGLRPVGAAGNGAFTLDPASGTGSFVLRAEVHAAESVRIDVLERGSDIVLLAQADRDVVFRGEDVEVSAKLLHAGQGVKAGRITARLHAPGGEVVRVLVRGRDGSYHGRFTMAGELAAAGLPWTISLEAEGTVAGAPVRRSTSTAVAVSVPTARATGTTLVRKGEALTAEVALEVASEGRYAATALLFGRNREGQLQPIAVGQTADQLTPGRRTLALTFDAATISASGLRGPFELRDLRLVDQGRLFVLHRQARGLAAVR